MENYINAINKYNVVAVIFSKQYFTIEKLDARMSTTLDIFHDENTLEDEKKLIFRINNNII